MQVNTCYINSTEGTVLHVNMQLQWSLCNLYLFTCHLSYCNLFRSLLLCLWQLSSANELQCLPILRKCSGPHSAVSWGDLCGWQDVQVRLLTDFILPQIIRLMNNNGYFIISDCQWAQSIAGQGSNWRLLPLQINKLYTNKCPTTKCLAKRNKKQLKAAANGC